MPAPNVQELIVEAQTIDELIRTALEQDGDIHGLVAQLQGRVVSRRVLDP